MVALPLNNPQNDLKSLEQTFWCYIARNELSDHRYQFDNHLLNKNPVFKSFSYIEEYPLLELHFPMV